MKDQSIPQPQTLSAYTEQQDNVIFGNIVTYLYHLRPGADSLPTSASVVKGGGRTGYSFKASLV